MLTLYHAPQSRSSRILWLLEELGADYELVITDIPRQDGSGAADPRNPHPDQKVPALGARRRADHRVDRHRPVPGRPLPEGGARSRHRRPSARAVPHLARLLRGCDRAGDHLPVRRPGRASACCSAPSATAPPLRAASASALEANPYLLGDRFSAADIVIASMGQFVRSALPPGARVDDYLRRCGARPALARAQAKDAG